MDKKQKTKRYFNNKKLLNAINNELTLKRWKILSKSYKLGRSIWGSKFTKARLADDMDMSYTTVLRCMALDKVNKKTWKLIKDKKISVFKVAQICLTKSVTYQDEIVDMVIDENLSTYQITSINIKDFKDISKEKHRLACEEGYSRSGSAYSNFQKWINRGKIFMMMDKKHLPKDKLPEIKDNLKLLNYRIKEYVK